jgi:hypothetical protein
MAIKGRKNSGGFTTEDTENAPENGEREGTGMRNVGFS